jgi:hypothetical protein
MSEPMIRGYIIAHTARFARAHLDEMTSLRFDAELSVELRALLAEIVPAGWYPRRHQVELMRGIADVRGRAEGAYGDLLLCGSSMAAIDNQFMTLLMRVMTPELFVKKLPKFWARDHQGGGSIEFEPAPGSSKHGRVRLRNVPGYDHSAVLWLGWMKQILDGLSAGTAEVVQSGWSWTSPGPSDVEYQVRWS